MSTGAPTAVDGGALGVRVGVALKIVPLAGLFKVDVFASESREATLYTGAPTLTLAETFSGYRPSDTVPLYLNDPIKNQSANKKRGTNNSIKNTAII